MRSLVNAFARHTGLGLAAALIAALTAFAAPAARAEIKVVASIAPIHSLVAQVMSGVGVPQLLIPAGTSPHGFAMKPSQAQALAESDAVFWVGGGLESALARPIKALAGQAEVTALSDVPDLVRHPVRDLARVGGHDSHGHDGHGHDHVHDRDQGQAHGAEQDDPHYWLDPDNAKAMIREIARVLSAIDPRNARHFAANAARSAAALDALTASYKQRLAPLRARPFIVFHDAYQYLERRFGLTTAGVLAVDPERPAGARHVSELRAHIREMKVRCLFMEPQFPARLASALVAGTDTRLATLDPLGSDLRPGPDLYAVMLTANLQSLESCLGDSAGTR